MSVPAISLYSSPHHSCQIGSSHNSLEFEPSSRASAAAASPPPPPSVAAQKVGGLSRMFSSASAAPAAVRPSPSPSFTANDDHGSFRQDRRDEFGSSFSYSPNLSAPFKRREESPVSVFRGPVSCSGSGSSKSPPLMRSPREWIGGDWRTGRDKLFKGFIRCALNSCIDYSSSSFSMPTKSGDLHVEELPFALEEEETCEPFAKKMLAEAQARHKVFYEEVVVEAFYEAEKAHRGQMRASGDPYLHHCVETAILLARIGAHATVVAAGLLHDTLDDSFIDYDHIFRKFGAGVADLVEGVSKLSHLSQLARDSNTASKTIEADRLHTMFLAMADTRVVLIKLADRLHNMMTLEALSAEKQQRFAKETLEIFVPLACRLGISSWKEKLENLCFKYLYPEEQKKLSLQLLKSFNEALVASAVHRLEKALVDEGINYNALSGRDKSLYSIYSKMLKKNLNMEEIHDIHGIRLIVENEEDCYKALDVVHRVWPKLIGRFKDYIRHPKFNGYQSLHTVVLSEDMLPLEVQIRTKEMHQQAEYGIAAHWKYKEGDCKHSSFVLQMVEWARWVLSWQCEAMNNDYSESLKDRNSTRPVCSFPIHADDCPYSYAQSCAHNGPIFVVMLQNENMSVLEFPTEPTVMDLMERVSGGGSRLGPCDFPVKLELRPKLNRELVSDPNQKLKMGDVVELNPALPDKSLIEYREDFQRMYEQELAVSSVDRQNKKPIAMG